MLLDFLRSKPSTEDRLRNLLAERHAALAAKTLEPGGELTRWEIESVEQLARLCGLAEAAKPKQGNRLLVAGTMVVTLAIVSFLLFVHVPSTDIEVDTTVSTAGFQVAEDATLTSGWRLQAAGIAGFREVALPALGDQPARTLTSESPFRLEALPDQQLPGSLTLAPVQVEKRTAVVFQPNPDGSYRMHLRAPRLRLRLNVHGRVRADGLGPEPLIADLRVPRAIVVEGRDSPLDIDLVLVKDSDATLLPLLPVEKLSLFSLEQFGDGAQARTRLVSSVVSGNLFFESLNGQERKLRESEDLRFNGVKGVLRNVHLMPGKMSVRYAGVVRGLTTGGEPNVRNLMPSWLEFFRAQRPVELLWITTAYLFGLVMAALKWLKASP